MMIRAAREGQKTVLTIEGRFDFNLHAEFRKYTEEALACPDTRTIVVSLARTSYLDSSALGMLLLLREKAANTGRHEVVLNGAKDLVRQVLDVANFGRLFRME